MSNIYSAVVVGLGRIGALYPSNVIPRSHIAAYNLNSRVKIVAGIDPSLDARQKFKKMWGKDIQLFKSVKEMLDADIYPDIVSICLEPKRLINAVKDFESYKPKIFFLEKPTITTQGQRDELKLILENTPTAINYHRCWDPKHQIFFDDIKSKKVFTFRILYSKGAFNYASHIIALLIKHYGEIQSVSSIIENENKTTEDPSESFIILFGNGLSAIFHGVDEVDYDLLELDAVTDDGIYSLKSGGCRKRHEVPIKNLYYDNYKSLNDSVVDNEDGEIEGLSQAIENIIDFLDNKTDILECDIKCGISVFNALNEIRKKP